MVEVVAGFIIKDGKVILAKRKKGDPLEGLWEFPGGKVEEGESLFDAIKREMIEELNIRINPIKVLTEIVHNYPHISFRMYLILGTTEDNPTPIESDEIVMVSPEDIDRMNLAEADKIAWERVKNALLSYLNKSSQDSIEIQ